MNTNIPVIQQADYDCAVKRLNKFLNLPSLTILDKKDVKASNTAPEPFDVILWCDELHIVEDSNSMSGTVRYLDGSLATNNFYWNFQGEFLYKIATISESDFKQLQSNYYQRVKEKQELY